MKTLTLFFCSLLLAAMAQGQIIHVPADYPTIQQGINASNNGDTVLVDPGTYVENINYNGKNIAVASLFLTTQDTSYISQTIIDGNHAGSVVAFSNNEDSTALLCGFTITNGGYYVDGAGIHCDNSSPYLLNIVITNNIAFQSYKGGGIYCYNSNLTIKNISISNNYSWQGGGICFVDSNPVLENVSITKNFGFEAGGGIFSIGSNPKFLNITIIGNSVHFNDWASQGGGICFYELNNPVFDSIKRSNIYLNFANFGNDLFAETPVDVILDTFTVINPSEFHAATLSNFSFDIQHGLLEQADADLFVSPDGNNANSGLTESEPLKNIYAAAVKLITGINNPHTIYLLEGTYSASVNGEIFPVYFPDYVNLNGSSNEDVFIDAEEDGRVFFIYNDPSISLHDLTIKGGLSNGDGGGVFCKNSNLTIENVTIKENSSQFWYGGGICCMFSNLTLRNVTITSNEGVASGGGIFCRGSDPILVNVTISDNSAFKGGGIYCEHNSDPVLVNTIMWDDSPQEIYFEQYTNPNSITLSYSNIHGGQAGIVTNGSATVNWLEGNIDEDPLFVGSGDHPYALSDGSPCIDFGTPDTMGLNLPPWDILGNWRIWDGNGDGVATVDMGAYEYGSIPVGIENPEVSVQSSKFEVRCYPNPFSNYTTFEYELKENAAVTLTIFNHFGKEDGLLVDEQQTKGTHRVQWNAKGLPAGVYYVQLKTGNQVMAKKIIKMN